MTMSPWTIVQLKNAMNEDLKKCNTDHERLMVKTVCGKEIRELAYETSKKRKLTPGEVAIASEFGYRS